MMRVMGIMAIMLGLRDRMMAVLKTVLVKTRLMKETGMTVLMTV